MAVNIRIKAGAGGLDYNAQAQKLHDALTQAITSVGLSVDFLDLDIADGLNEEMIPQLDFDRHIRYEPAAYGDRAYWYFNGSMIGWCQPLFNHLDCNWEVERELRRAKVIHPRTRTDTESCEMHVSFSSENAARNFVARFNAYMQMRGAYYERW